MKRISLLLLLLVVAGGYWFWTNQDRFHPQPETREVAPQRWQVAGVENSSSQNTTLSFETNATNASLDANATILPPADTVVGYEFVHDFARLAAAHYLPPQTERNPAAKGRLDLNIKSLNIRYGVDFPGLNVNTTDTLQARKTIFEHVLTPTVLEFLHSAYTPLFLDNLEDALRELTVTLTSGQQTAISSAQRQEMLTLLAAKLRAVGQAASALATSTSIRNLVANYLEGVEKVNQAHLDFWNVQSEGGSPAAASQAGTQIKATIQSREVARQRLLQAIMSTANPQGLDASELIYLSQWIYRRGNEDLVRLEQINKAAELLVKTAAVLEERAAQPMNFEPETKSELEAGNQTQ